MNKLFTKIAALALGATMAVGVGVAVGTGSKGATKVDAAPSTQKWEASSGAIAAKTSGTIENGDYDWSFTRSNVYTGFSSSCIQLGSKSGAETVTLTNSNYPGTISSVSVECSSYNGAHKIAISVGDTSYLAATATPKWTTVDTKTGTGSSSGTITISFTNGSRALYIKSISVTYETAVPTTSVDVSPATVTLAPGETQQLTTTVLPTNTTDTLTYSSTAAGVATVTSSGLITAVADGTATITATSGNYSDTCVVTVETPTAPFIAPEKTSTSGYTGCDETIGFTYGNLTGTLGVSTSNANVSAIIQNDDGDSADVVITFNTATASASSVYLKDGSTTLATITVTSITASSVTITGLPASATLYNNSTLDLGSQITVTATGSMSSDVSWESDDVDVATVSAAGVVTPVALGTANITVTSDDYPSATMTCSVTVEEALLQYVMTFGATKNTNPTEIKTNDAYHSTYSSVDSDVVASDFSKIYGISTSQLKCGSGSASAMISFTIPSSSYITSVVVVVATAGGTSMNVTSGAASAETENQTIAVGTLTFDEYLSSEKSNKVTLSSSASGAFYLTSITIKYANFTPELHASSTSVEAAVNTSNQSINLTYDYFTPTSYKATVKSGTSLTADAVGFSTSSTPHTATFTTGSSTGATVFTITGTGGGKSASVDVTVTVTEVRNLLTLTITTPSDATSFKVGQSFDVGSLEITATFDAAPTTVVYSKANNNLGALTFAPAIGYIFVDTDIGTVTSVIAELKIGTGDEYVEYTIAVTDKSYAAQVTDVADLWDGQQIYFGASDGSRVNVVHAGGNQLNSQEANVHETKGLCLDDLEHSAAYTVHREKIDGVIYYSFQNGGYYLEASSTSDNYLTRTDKLSDNCRYTISISSGKVTMTNKGNSSRPEFRWNSGSNWFSQYQSSSSLDKAVIYAITSYSEQAVADAFVERYLHMGEEVSGQCNTYYPILKPVWAAMADFEKAGVSGAAYERLKAWAAAHGEHLDSDMNIVSNSKIALLDTMSESSNEILIVVIISVISLTAIGGFVFLRKRREQN